MWRIYNWLLGSEVEFDFTEHKVTRGLWLLIAEWLYVRRNKGVKQGRRRQTVEVQGHRNKRPREFRSRKYQAYFVEMS